MEAAVHGCLQGSCMTGTLYREPVSPFMLPSLWAAHSSDFFLFQWYVTEYAVVLENSQFNRCSIMPVL